MKETATKKQKRRGVAKTPSHERTNGTRPRAKHREDQTAALTSELDAIRTSLNEMVERYKLKLEAELIQIDDAVRGARSYVGKQTPLPGRTTAAMLKRVKDLDIKPQKGRAKDFTRLQQLVADLIELLPAK